MSLTDLLTQPVTVTNRTLGAVDDYGNPTETWGNPLTYLGRIEHRDGTEVTSDQLVTTMSTRLLLPPDALVTADARVTDEDGNVYEVDGPPKVHRTPRGPHHVEAELLLVLAI